MKTRIVTAVCACLVLVFAATANGQTVKAGSDEDKAFKKIYAEKNPDLQIPLLQDFEKQFPQSRNLSDVYMMLVDIYTNKNDTVKVAEYCEKAIKVDQQNVAALVAASRVYAMSGKNLEVAVNYAQRAVENVEKMKSQSAPSNLTEADWKKLIKDSEEAAKSQLNYAKAVKN